MRRVIIYSVLLVGGMGLSQLSVGAIAQRDDLDPHDDFPGLHHDRSRHGVRYRQIPSGRVRRRLRHRHGRRGDTVAVRRALFLVVLQPGLQRIVAGRTFCLADFGGILFTMLAAAGLAATWLYKKARVLAIFDDLDTVLLMIPLKMMLIGFEPKLLVLILAVFLFLAAAYFCIHWLAGADEQRLDRALRSARLGHDLRVRLCDRFALGSFGAGLCARLRDQIRSFARLGGIRRREPRKPARTNPLDKAFSTGASKAALCCSPAWPCRPFNWVAWE